MYSMKYLIKVVNYFLPRQTSILQIKDGHYEVPAIKEGDIDHDGVTEIVGIYERNNQRYIMILKKFAQAWQVVWNSKIDKISISFFKMGQFLKDKGQQIVLGGEDTEKINKFMLLEWHNEALSCMLEEEVPFDKLYIEDVDKEDGIDEIIIWRYKELEVYDINLYRYKEHQLLEDSNLDPYYFKVVVGYYAYLHETYPEKKIYENALKEAKKRGKEIEKNRNEVLENEVLENEEADRALQEEILVGAMGCIESENCENTIYLMGKKVKADIPYIKNLRLIVTGNNENNYTDITINSEKIYQYKLFIGDFKGNGIEDIFLQVQTSHKTQYKHTYIYSYISGRLEEILHKGEDSFDRLYPFDPGFNNRYDICCERGCKATWLKWDGSKFDSYRLYSIVEEGSDRERCV